MEDKYVILFLVCGSVVLVMQSFAVLSYLVVQGRKEEEHRLEKERLQQAVLLERESTMNEISREIHDHVSQVLRFAQMNLKEATERESFDEAMEFAKRANDLLFGVADDLENIGKFLSSNYIKKKGLLTVLEKEVEYINLSCRTRCSLDVQGAPYPLDPEKQLLIYRIIQEAMHNAIRHSKASEINICFRFESDAVNVTIEDNGIGMPEGMDDTKGGLGLDNMKQRAHLLHASLQIRSGNPKGVRISLTCPAEKEGGKNRI